MAEKEILEGSKLIHTFLYGDKCFVLMCHPNGGCATPMWEHVEVYESKGYNFIFTYDKEWNKLMSAVVKILDKKFADGENYGFRTFGLKNTENGHYMVRFERYPLFDAPTLIEATFNAVVDVIKNLEK